MPSSFDLYISGHILANKLFTFWLSHEYIIINYIIVLIFLYNNTKKNVFKMKK